MLAKKTTTETFDPIAEGTHNAVCVGIIDLGLQINPFNNKEQRKIKLQWETDETYESDGKQVGKIISKDFTLSLDEKSTLYAVLTSWRGKKFTAEELEGFDMSTVLDKPCLVGVTHSEKDGRKYANVSSVMPLMKGQQPLARTRDLVFLDMREGEELTQEDCKPILEVYDRLPEYIRNTIAKSSTFEMLQARYMGKKDKSELKPAVSDEELPF